MRALHRAPPRRDRGAVTLEATVIYPVLLLTILAVMQAALWFYARSLALAAAQEGVRAGRAENATLADGVTAARRFADRAGADSLHDVSVTTAGSSATEVRIRVTGRSLSLLPGTAGITVTQQARGPVERFTTPDTP